jgi:hypothetical protein
MISKAQYRGRLSYEEYVKRFTMRQTVAQQSSLPLQRPQQQTMTDAAKKKAKDMFRIAVSKQTGIDTKEVSDAYDAVQGAIPATPEEARKKHEIITGIAINRAVQPNITALTDEEQDRAKMAKASKIAYVNDDEFRAAQDYMDEHSLGTIDKELSSGNGIVVTRPNGETELHYRGTNLKERPNYQDLITDMAIVTGTEQGISNPIGNAAFKPNQMVEAETQLQSAMAKYGTVEHIGGYSRGGGMALSLANKYNIPSTTFNPLIGPKAVQSSYSTTAKHTIIRTTEDPTTIGLAFGGANSDTWEVKAMKPLAKFQSKIPIKNIYDAHRLENMTEDGPRKIAEAEATQAHNRNVEASKIIGERVQLGEMREAISQGKSFSKYMEQSNRADSTTVNGKARLSGFRVFGDEPYTEGWYKVGGRFTEGEAEFINDTGAQIGKPVNEMKEQVHREISNADRKAAEFDLGRTNKGFFGFGTEYDLKPATEEQITKARAEAKLNRNPKTKAESRVVGREEEELIQKINKNDTHYNLDRENIDEFRQGAKSNEYLAKKSQAALNEHIEAAEASHNISSLGVEHSGLSDGWRAVNPTNLAVGFGIGYGISKGLDKIPGVSDFENTTGGRPTMDIVKGGLTGALQAGAQQALGGRKVAGALIGNLVGGGSIAEAGAAALGPEIAAGVVGFVVGDYTGDAVSNEIIKGGGSKNDAEFGGNVAGGVSGGFAGGLAAAGTAVIADAAFGTELGSVFGPVGSGVGALIGLGFGIGATAYSQGFSGLAQDFKDVGKSASHAFSDIGNDIASFF